MVVVSVRNSYEVKNRCMYMSYMGLILQLLTRNPVYAFEKF